MDINQVISNFSNRHGVMPKWVTVEMPPIWPPTDSTERIYRLKVGENVTVDVWSNGIPASYEDSVIIENLSENYKIPFMREEEWITSGYVPTSIWAPGAGPIYGGKNDNYWAERPGNRANMIKMVGKPVESANYCGTVVGFSHEGYVVIYDNNI